MPLNVRPVTLYQTVCIEIIWETGWINACYSLPSVGHLFPNEWGSPSLAPLVPWSGVGSGFGATGDGAEVIPNRLCQGIYTYSKVIQVSHSSHGVSPYNSCTSVHVICKFLGFFLSACGSWNENGTKRLDRDRNSSWTLLCIINLRVWLNLFLSLLHRTKSSINCWQSVFVLWLWSYSLPLASTRLPPVVSHPPQPPSSLRTNQHSLSLLGYSGSWMSSFESFMHHW